MVRQTVIGTTEVEPFVFNSCPEIPLSGDEEAMGVAEIVVERVVHFVLEQIVRVFVRGNGRRLGLICRGASDDCWADCDEKQADKEQSYVFHRSRRLGYISDEPVSPDVSGRKYSGKAIIRESRESLRHATSRAPSRSAPTQVWCNPRLRFRLIVLERESFSV